MFDSIVFSGEMLETGQKVEARRVVLPTAETFVVSLPDGRVFQGYLELSNLLKPGETPPPQDIPDNLPPGAEFTPIQYAEQVDRQLWDGGLGVGNVMTCTFKYDADAKRTDAGTAACKSPSGETILLKWKI
ncbi:hypothetical protein [Geminicoccus harenae]|uniref:hypothetical protein n=1 Tax=Geminicoccus harenae TaxID=2498453 RepID=UPI00168AC150|nr:hypothetical protein [Geminicoccus harenae]